MKQPLTEPEYSLEQPLEEMRHSIARSEHSNIDWDQVVVDLVVLSQALKRLLDISENIHTDMERLVRSLQEPE